MRRSTYPLVLALGITALLSQRAHAQIFSTFTARSTFAAGAGPLVTEAFNQPRVVVPREGATYATAFGSLTFDANTLGNTFGGGDVFAESVRSGVVGPQFLRFTFSAPVTSFGADFGLFDIPGTTLSGFIGGNAFTISEGFFGVRSTTPFTSFTLGNSSDNTAFVLDNVSVAFAVSTVPEPSTALLLFGGLAAIAATTRAKRAAARRSATHS